MQKISYCNLYDGYCNISMSGNVNFALFIGLLEGSVEGQPSFTIMSSLLQCSHFIFLEKNQISDDDTLFCGVCIKLTLPYSSRM